jgi:hypothetical protein
MFSLSLSLSLSLLFPPPQCCKFGFTGAAPITTETLSYFGALGIQVKEYTKSLY